MSPSGAPSTGLGPGEVGPGVRLGRYEILLGVAQGGMARVWAAKQHGQRGFSKTVAVKTILPALAMDQEFETMFLDEARIAAGVHHPNVCEIFDLGEENGTLYLAMEWVNGESLARVLKPRRPASPERAPTAERLNARIAARIVSDACAGLHAAHELCDENGNRLGVVHRDVSPQNILIGVDGNTRVTDFGVAKALGSAHEATTIGQIKGKAAYMSPEQAAGSRVDRRSDVFALGIVLYEATTGQRPFSGESQLGTVKQILAGTFDPPSVLVPGYPRELEAIVLRAMAMDPMQRFPTADRMRVALEEWIARSGAVVTETQVGTLVRERVGAMVDERMARIRQLMQSSAPALVPTPSLPPPVESASAPGSHPSQVSRVSVMTHLTPGGTPAPHQFGAPLTSKRGSPALLGAGLGLGAFAVFAMVGAAIFLSRGGTAAPSAELAVSAPAPPAAPKSPSPSAAAKEPTRGPPIRLRLVIPSEGVRFELDGKPLPAIAREIPRPPPGGVELLKVSADGYQEDVLRVDDSTGEVLDVLLAKASDAPAARAAPLESAATAARAEPPAATAMKPAADEPAAAPKPAAAKPAAPKPGKPDIPENPF
ncbi:MAG: serine/threonine-protein kinase [Sorangiineae bacterium]|nr:serine/threonine-protein kinase [Polyangiaceae bacterium]MEB2321055.1 serine/threonine-protein kinase [Sorangiineae bacterium]